MRSSRARSLRWCVPVVSLFVFTTACGSSDDSPELDESLVTQVRAGFAQIQKADGATTELAIDLDLGSDGSKKICMVVTAEAKSASPNGERAELRYLGSAATISPDGTCSEGDDARSAIVDGSVAYLPSESSTSGRSGCDATYERKKITKSAAAELHDYADENGTSKIADLLKVTKTISKDGRTIVLELDPDKVSSELGSGGDLPDDSSATMTVSYGAGTTMSGINLAVNAAELEMHEYVSYKNVGVVQHLALPKTACIEPGTGTVTSVSEITSSLGMGS